jgi:hypothetical protein
LPIGAGNTATATATIPVLGTPTTDTTPQITYTHTGSPASVVFYWTNNGGTLWNIWDTDATPTGPPDTFQTTTALPGSGTYGIMAKSPSEAVPSGAGSIEITPYIVDVTGPSITNTVPANTAVGVLVTANVVVTFNEPVNPASLTYTCGPPGIVFALGWTGGQTIVTFYHNATPFTAATLYTFQITACTDVLGNALVAGAIQNPWTFTTAGGPSNPPPQVDTLIATGHQPTVADIQLEWTNPAGATSFNIYRSTSVRGTGFNFAVPYATTPAGVGKTIYVDLGAYADASNYSWVVRAVSAGGENTTVPTVGSNMGFKLMYNLFRGTGPNTADMNYISLPYRVNYTSNDAIGLRAEIRNFGAPTLAIASVARFNSNSGLWEIRTGAGTNFPLTPSEGYRVAMAPGFDACTFKIVGAYNRSVITNMIRGTGPNTADMNYISLPYHYTFATLDAIGLRADIRANGAPTLAIASVARWNSNSGLWEIRTGAGTNFALTPGEGYRVAMAPGFDACAWTCPAATPGP